MKRVVGKADKTQDLPNPNIPPPSRHLPLRLTNGTTGTGMDAYIDQHGPLEQAPQVIGTYASLMECLEYMDFYCIFNRPRPQF